MRDIQAELSEVAMIYIEQMRGRWRASDMGSVESEAMHAVSRGARYRPAGRLGAERRLPSLVRWPPVCAALRRAIWSARRKSGMLGLLRGGRRRTYV